MLRIYNTIAREKQDFVPQDPKRVTMYVCGPTVYNHAHIGNFRPVIVFDTLFRLLRATYGDDAVIYARNITDVEDKIIATAEASGVSIKAVTSKYADIYNSEAAAINALPPTIEPWATDHIDEMIVIIGSLVEKGHAYVGESGVWFHVPSMENYGRLSGRKADDNEAGARVAVEDEKRDASDFALWKFAKPGEPEDAIWESPWGRGRPGWHIECSAMAAKQLGTTIDIHGGGVDLQFPHHENEIAQSECCHSAPMARYWMHNGFLDMAGEKMSKSLGNVVLLKDLLQDWDGEVIRFAMLSGHYRAPLDWTEDLLRQAKVTLDRIYGALRRVWDAST
ncbi:MAG: cysteine--tRNA ligase, partial [Pseudomonadota bacterium]